MSPRHVLVSPNLAAVKIAHFGPSEVDVVSELDSTLRTGAHALRSFHYLAPKRSQSATRRPTHAATCQNCRQWRESADLYATGVIFYEMLTGRPPRGKFTPQPRQRRVAPPATDVLVLKCLARDLEQRYSSANALLAEFDGLEEARRLPRSPTFDQYSII